MAIMALHSAATGLKALSTQLDVISNNLANANHDGFKSSRVNFEDLFYQNLAQPGSETNAPSMRVSGLQVGLGTRVASTQLDFTKGSAIASTGPMDLYIDGDGFFQVKVLQGQGDSLAYTRTGKFVPDKDGNLVLNLGDGYKMEPPVQIPPNASNIAVSADGRISYTLAGSTTSTQGPQLQLAKVQNPSGLVQIGGNLYQTSASSGTVTMANPGSEGLGGIKQGYVESSNVDPVTELVSLIKTQRTFELNSQSIQAADQMLQQVNNLRH